MSISATAACCTKAIVNRGADTSIDVYSVTGIFEAVGVSQCHLPEVVRRPSHEGTQSDHTCTDFEHESCLIPPNLLLAADKLHNICMPSTKRRTRTANRSLHITDVWVFGLSHAFSMSTRAGSSR